MALLKYLPASRQAIRPFNMNLLGTKCLGMKHEVRKIAMAQSAVISNSRRLPLYPPEA